MPTIYGTKLNGPMVFETKVFRDGRGYFFEAFNQKAFAAWTGLDYTFVQDNVSVSVKNVIRGLHYQVKQPQGKLVRVLRGEIFDVAVDIRPNSTTFGKYMATFLSAINKATLWVPPNFAHGFMVISKTAEVIYKTTDYYAPEYERTIIWNDPDIGVKWPLEGEPILSPKDAQGKRFKEAELPEVAR